jgi:type II secretory ATPase GspE/PulE/Tfp pilus assembly ATPase PilB-like protein
MGIFAGEPQVYRLDDYERISNSPKPYRVVDAILLRMIREGASEVQFEFPPRDIRLSRCVNGEWGEQPSPPVDFRAQIIRRMREIAGQEPQDPPQPAAAHVRLIAPEKALESEVEFKTTESGEVAAIRMVLQPRA